MAGLGNVDRNHDRGKSVLLLGNGLLIIYPMNLNYVLSIVWFILWIVALVDCLKSNNPNKVVWIIVIILLPFLGSILYFILGRRV